MLDLVVHPTLDTVSSVQFHLVSWENDPRFHTADFLGSGWAFSVFCNGFHPFLKLFFPRLGGYANAKTLTVAPCNMSIRQENQSDELLEGTNKKKSGHKFLHKMAHLARNGPKRVRLIVHTTIPELHKITQRPTYCNKMAQNVCEYEYSFIEHTISQFHKWYKMAHFAQSGRKRVRVLLHRTDKSQNPTSRAQNCTPSYYHSVAKCKGRLDSALMIKRSVMSHQC